MAMTDGAVREKILYVVNTFINDVFEDKHIFSKILESC